MQLAKIIELATLGDPRGQLTVIEGGENIPFEIKRIYYLTKTLPGISRGFHAHKNLKQLAVCVSGKCRILLDNGAIKESVWLDSPSKAILIDSFIWREMHDFSSDCVLLVAADDHYKESDYIRSYDDFLRYIKDGKKTLTF